MRLTVTLVASALLALPVVAQQPLPLPANYVRVDAPFAQQLTVKTKAAHPEIKKLGLHATLPGGPDNAIIGSDTPAKIGKKSSAADMEHLGAGKPFVVRIEKEGIYDLLLPIADRDGHAIDGGFVVMEVPLDKAASQEEALRIGSTIRDEMQQQIPTQAALYR